MKKIKSTGIFDTRDFPINFVRTGILKGTGIKAKNQRLKAKD